jgi:ribosomal-protein-alanine N-acetyltransferase
MTDIDIDLGSDADREWSAKLMASSEPWLTLGRDFATCLAYCRDPQFVVLIARRVGARCGFLLLHPTGSISAVRGQGVGSELLDAAERWFPKARHMFLCVSSFNTRARKLYERRGYTSVGEFPDYVIDGASEILMHKRLVRP